MEGRMAARHDPLAHPLLSQACLPASATHLQAPSPSHHPSLPGARGAYERALKACYGLSILGEQRSMDGPS